MLFRLTIPGNPQMVPVLRQVAERVAQCAGYSAAEAARVAASVGHAVETVMQRLNIEGAEREPLEMRFEREDLYLDVWLYYHAPDGGRALPDPAVSGEALRQGMDSVEFGREGEMNYCRLRRVLPREKTDHQCEMPPDR